MVEIDEIRPNALYTALEAAELLRCGKTNIYDAWQSGELAVINIGVGKKGKRVKGSHLLEFLDSRTEGGPRPKMAFKRLKGMN